MCAESTSSFGGDSHLDSCESQGQSHALPVAAEHTTSENVGLSQERQSVHRTERDGTHEHGCVTGLAIKDKSLLSGPRTAPSPAKGPRVATVPNGPFTCSARDAKQSRHGVHFALQVATLALFFHSLSDGGQRLHVPAMQLPANSLEEQPLSRISAKRTHQ